MTVVIIVIDSIFLIVVWISPHDMLLGQVQMAYYDTIGNEAAAEHWKKRRWFTRGGRDDWGMCAVLATWLLCLVALILV
jgi:hypothetical protein